MSGFRLQDGRGFKVLVIDSIFKLRRTETPGRRFTQVHSPGICNVVLLTSQVHLPRLVTRSQGSRFHILFPSTDSFLKSLLTLKLTIYFMFLFSYPSFLNRHYFLS